MTAGEAVEEPKLKLWETIYKSADERKRAKRKKDDGVFIL